MRVSFRNVMKRDAKILGEDRRGGRKPKQNTLSLSLHMNQSRRYHRRYQKYSAASKTVEGDS